MSTPRDDAARASWPRRVALMVYGDLRLVRSGGNVYDANLVEHWNGRGVEVDIVQLPFASFERALAHNAHKALRRDVTERLVSGDYDLVVQDELIHPSVLDWNESLRALVGAPLVSIVHHLRSDEAWPTHEATFYRKMESLYLDSIDAFIFNSETTKRSVDGLSPLSDRLSVVATPGGNRLIDIAGSHRGEEHWQRLIQRRLRRPGLEILFIGNVIPRKGLMALIDAVGSLVGSGVSLHVVGRESVDADYAAALRARVERHSLGDRVVFHGELPDDELVPLLTRCHVFAMPSTYEGFGIAYLEAMSFALPVVASSHGAAGELVGDLNGRLVAPNRPEALTRVLRALAEDRALLETLSQGARKTYERYPTWEQTGEKTLQFLSRLRLRLTAPGQT